MTTVNDQLAGGDQRAAQARATELQQRVQQRVRSGVRRAGGPADVVRRRSDAGPAPLSISQRQLWYLAQAFPESTAYNELVTLRKDGAFEVDAFRWAFAEFVRRHEAWRTTFEIVDGEPCQVVHPPVAAPDVPLELLDLSGLPRAEAERRADELAAEEISRPFDLTTGPFVRPRLVRFAADHHRLYLGLHHLVFDGVTLSRILLPEIVALYDAAVAGQGSPLPEPRVQYPDYATWELAWTDGPAATARLERWRRRLAGVPTLELPLDHPRPAERRFTGGLVPLTIDAGTVEALRAAGRRVNASLFHVVAALHAWWLGSYAGSDDVVFATVGDLRQRPELVGMAGYCLAPVVIRVDLSTAAGDGADRDRGPTTSQLTRRVRDRILDSLDDIVPFERLVRHLGVPRDPRMNPIFQTDLVLEPPMIVSDPQWSLHPMENAVGAAVARSKFDLSIELDERPDGHVQGRLFYDAELFDPDTAAAMTRHWLTLLDRAAAEPDQPLAELDLVDPDERDRLPADPDLEPVPGPATVPEVIRAQAARTRGAVAVEAGDRTLTYDELQRAAEEVARQLAAAGAGVGTLVATVFDRTVDLVVGLLGVLTCGAAYVPLNPQDPADRLGALVEDSGSTLVLTTSALMPGLPALGVPTLTVDGPAAAEVADVAVPSPVVAPHDLAYLIYTSGSTGTPKGVLVEHRSVTQLMATLLPAMGLSAADTVVCVTSYTFDMSVGSIFGALALGSRLVLASAEQVADPRALALLLEAAGATYLAATPTTWSALLESGWSGGPRLVADCGGEALPDALAAALAERCAAVWNWYGPTETTDAVAGGRVVPGERVAVGRPLPGSRVYVLDRRLRPVRAGVPGEVVIGGSGVARGYLDRPAETARRFVPDPFGAGGRVYRSGDRGRFLPDGRLQLLGRLDDQIKIRGVRIEPAEIEAVLLAHPDVSAAVVVARPDAVGHQSVGQQRLVAYLVADPDGAADAAIRSWVRARLPAQLVPSVIVRVAAVPRTVGGKVDRAALPEPQSSADPRNALGRAPASVTERRVAEVWSAALGTEIVDVDADFFDLGGHSLLAARVIGEVERRFGTPVRLSDFLRRGTTVAGLAALVDMVEVAAAGESAASASRPTPQGLSRPLFVVYPDVTTAVGLRHLSAEFGSRQPIHPLLPHEMFGRFDRVAGLEGLARTMLTELRHEQGHGPYALAGFSLGGLLAYDIARQLTELGEQVEWLGLLDAGTPEVTTAIFQRMVALSGRRARQRQRTRRERWAKYVEVAGRMVSRQVLTRLRGTTPPQQFDDHGAQAIAHAYARPGHHLPMEVFVTADSRAATGSDSLGWTEMHRGPLRLHQLPGDHLTLLQPPLVHDVARLILAQLGQARAAGAIQ